MVQGSFEFESSSPLCLTKCEVLYDRKTLQRAAFVNTTLIPTHFYVFQICAIPQRQSQIEPPAPFLRALDSRVGFKNNRGPESVYAGSITPNNDGPCLRMFHKWRKNVFLHDKNLILKH